MDKEEGKKEDIVSSVIEHEMRQSYLDYAMSVIVGRALPDVRDGLKPVHRRILYSMNELGNDYNKPYKKSARIVGEVIGKYHPHGDQAVYDALVRMAQPFSMRYPLVDGQGNFGSIDGDSPAAMRYTEVRLTRIARELLEDLAYDTAKFLPNYDESLKEPSCLPSSFHNLLVNGSQGIAVGMSTSIPPHNLREIIDALLFLIDNPSANIEDVLKIIPGPDFPGGGIIHGLEAIKQAYTTGHGILKVRARIHQEHEEHRLRLVATEFPYLVNKARTLEDVASLVLHKKIEGIRDIRDESDREGLRVVIELKSDANPEVVENQLYKHTAFESSFSVHIVALVENQPKLLNLMDILRLFIAHKEDTITKRSIFLLRKAQERIHMLEALAKALEIIDKIIAVVKNAKDPGGARNELVKQFGFSFIQAKAITDMKLERLTHLEGEKTKEDLKKTQTTIDELSLILSNKTVLKEVMVNEFQKMKESYGDHRRTEIIEQRQNINKEDLIQDEEMIVVLTQREYIKRTNSKQYKTQRHGGKGYIGLDVKDNDVPVELCITSNLSTLLFFTSLGRVIKLKAYEIPETDRNSRGRPLINFITKEKNESVMAILSVNSQNADGEVIMATAKGLIKRTNLDSIICSKAKALRAINLLDNDKLVKVVRTGNNYDLLAITKMGQGLRFKIAELRSTGRTSRGIRCMKLKLPQDEIAGIEIVNPKKSTFFICSSFGYGKRVDVSKFSVHHRGSSGMRVFPVTSKTGYVIGFCEILKTDTMVLMTDNGRLIRFKTKEISRLSRQARGVKLMDLKGGEYLQAMARIEEE